MCAGGLIYPTNATAKFQSSKSNSSNGTTLINDSNQFTYSNQTVSNSKITIQSMPSQPLIKNSIPEAFDNNQPSVIDRMKIFYEGEFKGAGHRHEVTKMTSQTLYKQPVIIRHDTISLFKTTYNLPETAEKALIRDAVIRHEEISTYLNMIQVHGYTDLYLPILNIFVSTQQKEGLIYYLNTVYPLIEDSFVDIYGDDSPTDDVILECLIGHAVMQKLTKFIIRDCKPDHYLLENVPHGRAYRIGNSIFYISPGLTPRRIDL